MFLAMLAGCYVSRGCAEPLDKNWAGATASVVKKLEPPGRHPAQISGVTFKELDVTLKELGVTLIKLGVSYKETGADPAQMAPESAGRPVSFTDSVLYIRASFVERLLLHWLTDYGKSFVCFSFFNISY